MTELFWELLRSAIWNTPYVWHRDSVKPDDWYGLLEMARRQAVSGILFKVIESLPPQAGVPGRVAAAWMVDAMRIEQRNDGMARTIGRMRELWRSYGVDAVLIKGVETASMYPFPQLRVCGDVDWVIAGRKNWKRSVGMLKDRKIPFRYDSDGDITYAFDGVTVENHRKDLRCDGAEGVLVMLNEHIFHHAMVTGIGIRHLCDMAMAYKFYAGKYDAGKYMSELGKIGLKKWTSLLDSSLVRYLGMPDELVSDNGWMHVPDNDTYRFITLSFKDGDLGMDKKDRFSGFRSRSRLFLKYAPLYWLGRWTRLVCGRIARHCG